MVITKKIFSSSASLTSSYVNRVINLFGCYLLLSCNSALARQDIEYLDSLLNMSLKELHDIEITSSTLTPMRLQNAPSSVTVFTHKQIVSMGVDYLYELTNFAPGFQTFRQGENSIQHYHSARGHRSSASSREVLVLIDGVRVNREFDNASAIPMISLHNIDKVEFIRGPGSALYGSNAFLGVIDIKTLKQRNQVQLVAGEADRKQLSAIGSTRYKAWSVTIAANLFDEEGVNYQLENYDTFEAEKARDPREGEDIQININNGRTQIDAMYFNRLAEDFYITDKTSDDNNRTQYRSAALRLQQTLVQKPTYTATLSASYSNNYIARRLDNTSLMAVENSTQEEDNLDVKFYNMWQYHKNNKLVFGAERRHSEFDPFEFEVPSFSTEIYPKSDRGISGVYLQHQSQLDNGLQITLGGRYDHYETIASEFSPRLGVVYPVTPHQTLKVLYGEAFRAPTVNELTLAPPGGQLKGNPALEPETIKTWELIWLGQWEQQSFAITSYYNVIDAAIYRTTESPSSFANQSDDEAFYGLELEYSVQLSEHLRLSSNASLMENLPASDIRQADRLASLVVNYQHRRWNMNLSGNYAGHRQTLTGGTPLELDDYWLVNAKWLYSVNKQFSVFVTGKNILDEDYQTPSQLPVHTIPMPNRGRELAVGIAWRLE